MPFQADSDDLGISPIPIHPKASISPNLQISPRWISPHATYQQQMVNRGDNDKMAISSAQRSDISREVYYIIRTNLPESIQETMTLPQILLISRSVEQKLFQTATSCSAYLDKTTIKFRITALACAILIHSEELGGRKSPSDYSDTFVRLITQARSSLPHCTMVLVSYERRRLAKELEHGNPSQEIADSLLLLSSDNRRNSN